MSSLYEALRSGDRSTKKNTAFRPTHFNPTATEDRKLERLSDKMQKCDFKLDEMKLEMERILLQKEELIEETTLVA